MLDMVPSNLIDLATAVRPAGSRVTCNPPVLDTDADFIVLVPAPVLALAKYTLRDEGFTGGTDDEYKDAEGAAPRFFAYRKGAAKIILTHDLDFFAAFTVATAVAKRLNLLDKADRVALFQAVLYRKASAEDLEALLS
mgnify:CR=1 FL=1